MRPAQGARKLRMASEKVRSIQSMGKSPLFERARPAGLCLSHPPSPLGLLTGISQHFQSEFAPQVKH